MNPFSLSAYITSIATFSIGLFVYTRRREYRLNQIFFVYSLSIASWAFLTATHASVRSYYISLYCARLMHFSVPFMPLLFYHFVIIFLDEDNLSTVQTKLIQSGYFIASCLGILAVTTSYIVSDVKSKLGYVFFMNPGTLYFCVVIFFIIYSYLGLRALYYRGLTAQGLLKKQINFLFFGSLIGWGMGVFNFLPVYDITFFPYSYSSYGVLIYVFLTAYAISRYRLFDLDALVAAFQQEKLATLGLLTASINHEIRNPLYLVKGLLETQIHHFEQSQVQQTEKPRELAEKAVSHLGRVFRVIEKLNRFTKPANVQLVGGKQRASVLEAVKAVLDLIQNEVHLSGHEIKNQLPADLPLVCADQTQLEEIIFNLLVNACHAMKVHGTVTIRADVIKDHVRMMIEDTGPGFSAEARRNLFKPFNTTKGDQGTGLGLYLTKQLIELNGGRISLHENLGNGATIKLVLLITRDGR